jgi:predicted ArsR family transcriptional regulator
MLTNQEREVLEAAHEIGAGEGVSVVEVADHLGISESDAQGLLNQLMRGFYVTTVIAEFTAGGPGSMPAVFGLTGKGRAALAEA